MWAESGKVSWAIIPCLRTDATAAPCAHSCRLRHLGNYPDMASRLDSFPGRSNEKSSRFAFSLESSVAHLNLLWTIRSCDAAETRVWGKGGNVRRRLKEGFRVELPGELVGIVQELISLWESCTSWFWWRKKKSHKSLSGSFQDLWETFSISILPLMHTWILSRTRDRCPSKEFDWKYLGTQGLSLEVYLK